ncbi:MAG: hypothetical protein U1E29_04435 [Coriobacteriia bacterium]|nr:hypothetical protein [Coriobacteriia bacterium]
MVSYDGMLLRSVAEHAGVNAARFDAQLEFVEWTALQAPSLALQRARELKEAAPRVFVDKAAVEDYMWCRLAMETAAKYQHASGDALARLVYSTLTGDDPGPVLQLSNFERSLAPAVRDCVVVRAAKRMRKSPEWSYVVAFSNTLKHMSVINHQYHLDVVDVSPIRLGESSGFMFRQFEYKGRTYPECSQAAFEGVLSGVREDLFLVLDELGGFLAARRSG